MCPAAARRQEWTQVNGEKAEQDEVKERDWKQRPSEHLGRCPNRKSNLARAY